MATITAIGTNQNKWTIQNAVSGGSLSGVGSYAHSTTPWTSQNNRFVMTTLQEANSFALMFYGTDAALEKGLARIWGVSAVPDPTNSENHLGSFLADVEVVLGATSANTGVFADGPYYFADKINVLDDATDTPPGGPRFRGHTRIVGPHALRFGRLLDDHRGSREQHIEQDRPALESPLMAVTWAIDSAEANNEGRLIVLEVTAAANNGELDETPSMDESNAGDQTRIDAIGPIKLWRLDKGTGDIFKQTGAASAKDGHVTGVVIYEIGKSIGTAPNKSVAFKVAIHLRGPGWIAPNNQAADAKFLRLREGWATLGFDGSSTVLKASQVDNKPFDPDAVGKLPTGSLRLNTDAHAEWAEQDPGGSSMTMMAWEDLSQEGNNLTGQDDPVLKDTFTGGTPVQPVVEVSASSPPERFELASPPVITTIATIAAVIEPNTVSAVATIVGRYNENTDIDGRSWRLYYDGSDVLAKVIYQTKGSGDPVSLALTTDESDQIILVVFRRADNPDPPAWSAWINGRTPGSSGSVSSTVNSGGGPLSVAARRVDADGWGEAFDGNINQIALYDAVLDDLKVSLVMHNMAQRATIALGEPIPSSMQTQPFTGVGNRRALLRRPVALMDLFSGLYNPNPFGQRGTWRPSSIMTPQQKTEAIKAFFRDRIREALVGCDQFEIMFNRPGGTYKEDIVPSYVWGSDPFSGAAMIADFQWDALEDLFDEFNLTDEPGDGERRGWFYTGGGLPLNDDGTLLTTGHMQSRRLAPATATVYKEQILDKWPAKDDRYRCLMCDATSPFAAKWVEVVQDSQINENFVLVGEAIATSDAARKGAPWMALARFPLAPWWNTDPDEEEEGTNRKFGYNVNWSADWSTLPTYFAVISTQAYLDLHIRKLGPPFPGTQSNLKLGDIYNWVRKGATPIAWQPKGYRRVGAAWDYGTDRIAVSRFATSPRIMRVARA